MKKIISTLAALALAVGYVGAQDLTEITEMYNSGAEAIAAGDKEGALKSFEQAYERRRSRRRRRRDCGELQERYP